MFIWDLHLLERCLHTDRTPEHGNITPLLNQESGAFGPQAAQISVWWDLMSSVGTNPNPESPPHDDDDDDVKDWGMVRCSGDFGMKILMGPKSIHTRKIYIETQT